MNYIYDPDFAPVLPRGTVLQITAWHDNNRGEQEQPRPPSMGGVRGAHGR